MNFSPGKKFIMKRNTQLILNVTAAAALAAGLALALVTLAQMTPLTRKIQKKIDVYRQLSALKSAQDQKLAAVKTFEALPQPIPVALTTLAARTVTNATPEIREREARELIPGWTLKQVEIVFTEISLAQLPVFLQAAETQRPPWRLTECNLTASRQSDGFGRALLVLEAIGRSQP